MSEALQVFEELIGTLEEHKRYSVDMAKLAERSDFHKDRAPKMTACGTYVALQPRSTEPAATWHVVASNFCRVRLCPMCEWRKSLRLYSALLRVVDALPDLDWLLCTLTTPNVKAEKLGETITALYRESRLLLKRPELKCWIGWLRSTEVTYNSEADTYHPHLHNLVAVRPTYWKSRGYISTAKLRSLWPLGDQVDLRRVRDPRRGCCEVAKYATKPLIFPKDEALRDKYARVYDTLCTELHGRRLVQAGGCVKAALAALRIDLEADDTEGVEEADLPLLALSWAFTAKSGAGAYIQTDGTRGSIDIFRKVK